MPCVCYEDRNLRASTLATIRQANDIIAEYEAEGYDLTLRQLYYQFVSRDLIPNNQREYKKLGEAVAAGRRAGLIDWDRIVDRTRNLHRHATWSGPAAIVAACASQFAVDLWAGQPYRPEVWVEKDALVGVLQVACDPLQVPYFSCRGYTSDSEAWSAAQRLGGYRRASGGQAPVVFHLGDHDPSGIDMTRDITDRIKLFSRGPCPSSGSPSTATRSSEYGPPPNPAKATDSSFAAYQAIARRRESWELDALSPAVIGDLIAGAVRELIEPGPWQEATGRQAAGRARLRELADGLAAE
jgi:hypothetical protein